MKAVHKPTHNKKQGMNPVRCSVANMFRSRGKRLLQQIHHRQVVPHLARTVAPGGASGSPPQCRPVAAPALDGVVAQNDTVVSVSHRNLTGSQIRSRTHAGGGWGAVIIGIAVTQQTHHIDIKNLWIVTKEKYVSKIAWIVTNGRKLFP